MVDYLKQLCEEQRVVGIYDSSDMGYESALLTCVETDFVVIQAQWFDERLQSYEQCSAVWPMDRIAAVYLESTSAARRRLNHALSLMQDS
ncbi:hypothetical protein [Leptolyngbya sp. FACHB-261]|uniref:hypothetical protein n=1 Tax=Leptolyngbya sp. FACHB-261 TaxID=2692806 RepID=UPI0016858AE9|nr:hypothetical protein [Leptolyngbya sp. FACHB-261]MBD2101240.1 hypothetical protein [Leptolyngbya sp. FACHB-261]